MKNIFTVLMLMLAFRSQVLAQTSIIPQPRDFKANGKVFKLNAQTKIYYQKGLKDQALLLASALSPATGYDFALQEFKTVPLNGIILATAKGDTNKEAYHLLVDNKQIKITGANSAGVFYGIQSLLQLLPAEIYNKERQKNIVWNIKGAVINDSPEYPWRGMMLDVSRYFFSKEYVLKFIDMMAMYKMNVLHFHLIDDAGWRLEIKKYPKLTSIGG